MLEKVGRKHLTIPEIFRDINCRFTDKPKGSGVLQNFYFESVQIIPRISCGGEYAKGEIMLDNLEYTQVEGEKLGSENATIFALSTCGYCAEAMEFLRKNDVGYQYVYIDKLPVLVKENVKGKLRGRFGNQVMFPLIIFGKEKENEMVGFNEDTWKEKLGL